MGNYEKIARMVLEGPSDVPQVDWKADLLRSEHGGLKPLLANAITLFGNAPPFAGLIKFNEFATRIMLLGPPPWEHSDENWTPRPWSDVDDIRAAEWLQRQGIAVNPNIAGQAITAVAERQRFHPLVEYLDSCEWDGQPRLATWLSDYLCVPNTPYHSQVGRCALIAAVARIRRPGSKVDTMPILEGAQGLGKSTLLRLLFEPWYSDEIADFGSKDAAMQLSGAWLIEISELDAMSRADAGRIKAFISRTTDRYRPPYGSRVIEQPRSCVFWGTTNSDAYLKDETGGRRFWPVKIGKIDLGGLAEVRNQLWAEAQHAFAAGEKWWFEDQDVQAAAADEQRARNEGDPWDNLIGKFVATRSAVTIPQILTEVFNLPAGQWEQREQNRVARCLKSLGFVRKQKRKRGDRIWFYQRSDGAD
ncbi:putative P-loop ATPase [Bradyrhizobium sp. USDA 3686]|uniref:virulence-associated E family protein n=1 Tax=Bradyrhizobium canariense TaxID=255045 RepID=UPI00195ECC40|nr:virulence-associated E family protein [Bradyrhizobium canariense]MBM7488137.1 putative P-loop ATPase [Bradyrhizobium canariense]